MSEDGAEKGSLQSQALIADTVSGNEGADSSDSDDYDPSKTVQDQYSAGLADDSKQNTISNFSSLIDSSTSDSAQRTLVSGTLPQDPHSSVSFPSKTPSRAESKDSAQVSQMGGLEEVVPGDDDNGDGEYEPPAALSSHVQDSMSNSADVSLSEHINENVSLPPVSQQQSVQDQTTTHVSTSSSVPVSHIDIPAPNDGPSKTIQDESNLPARSTVQSANGSVPTTPTVVTASRARLPHDRVGILEDRIQADPRGDVEAWLELINEHRSRNKLENARQVYERFFKIFPTAAEQWVAYANMESENNELYRLEQVFNKSLLTIPNVQLWSVYLDYVRRRNNLTTDAGGQARRIISAAYDFALQNIGIDKEAGTIWVDYIQFIRSGPGNIGGSGWQDQQKMDLLRKAYQRAICIPTQNVNMLWKEYDQFEMGLNKLTGRKFLQERSPSYMTARSSYTELQNITKFLIRSSLPKLPPAPGFDGDVEYAKQIDIWKRWIQWEKDDPLVLKEEDAASYKARVLYVYKQSLMALRFLPEIWFEAADFCFQNGMESDGNDLLKQGIDANPESCLLTFKRADRLEISTASEQDAKKRGARVREPYDKLLDTLYDLIAKVRAEETQDIARVEEKFAQDGANQSIVREHDDDDDERDDSQVKEAAKTKEIEAVKKGYAEQIGLLSKTVSFAWIALMRAMRRIQGKGKPGEIAGSRQIFADARKRGRITSDVYIASALLEYHCYKDPAATKIFERGAKLFPEDQVFALEYLKHLIDINDITNARAVFETTVRKLASNPENVAKAKPIFSFLHEYESRYGDLVQIISLESRMRELFPEDPTLTHFSHRYAAPLFDPTAFKPIVSPTQTKPKAPVSTKEPISRHNSPAPRHLTATTSSPKRAFALDDLDDDINRPRKFVRAESPLKGAAGRRLDQQKRVHHTNGTGPGGAGQHRAQSQPIPLPRDVVFLLSVIPPASSYDATRFSPGKMVNLLRNLEIPSHISQIRPSTQPPGGMGQAPMMGHPHYTGGYRT